MLTHLPFYSVPQPRPAPCLSSLISLPLAPSTSVLWNSGDTPSCICSRIREILHRSASQHSTTGPNSSKIFLPALSMIPNMLPASLLKAKVQEPKLVSSSTRVSPTLMPSSTRSTSSTTAILITIWWLLARVLAPPPAPLISLSTSFTDSSPQRTLRITLRCLLHWLLATQTPKLLANAWASSSLNYSWWRWRLEV